MATKKTEADAVDAAKKRIVRFWKENNDNSYVNEKQAEVHELLESYTGNEVELEEMVIQKYGVELGKAWMRECLDEYKAEAEKKGDAQKLQNNHNMATKEGHLIKMGGSGYKERQQRWFVLHGAELRYFKVKGDKSPAGTMLLTGANVRLAEPEVSKYGVEQLAGILISGPHIKNNKTYTLHASLPSERDEWVAALQQVALGDAAPKAAGGDGFNDGEPEVMEGFLMAVALGDKEALVKLVEKGADINAMDHNGVTPCHTASGAGRVEILQWLHEKGADINAKDKVGCTPCHSAAEWGKLEALQWLHGQGADINAKNNDDETPCDKAYAEREHNEGSAAILQWLRSEKVAPPATSTGADL